MRWDEMIRKEKIIICAFLFIYLFFFFFFTFSLTFAPVVSATDWNICLICLLKSITAYVLTGYGPLKKAIG